MVMVLILSMFPVTVSVADVNYGESEYGGSSGTGTSQWKYTTAGRGVRISIYFVEGGKENFHVSKKSSHDYRFVSNR
jgi:hypothetical protein